MLLIQAKKKKKLEKEQPLAVVPKSTADLLPQAKYDTENECFLLQDGTYLNLVEIQSKDLSNLSQSELEFDEIRFEKFYKIYAGDIKIVTLNYPCNTEEQQLYNERKAKQSNNQRTKYWLEKRRQELIWIAKNKTSREFYIMYFSKNLEENLKNISTIKNTLGTGKDGMVENMTMEKKCQIFSKLNNKNTLIA